MMTWTWDVVGSNLSPDIGYLDGFHCSPQSLDEIMRMVARVGYGRFLPDSLLSFIHCSSYHTTLYSIGAETSSLNNTQKIHDGTSQKFAQAITLLTCMWKALGSNLSPNTGYPDGGIFTVPPKELRYNSSNYNMTSPVHNLQLFNP
jgi:hypothetical protein